MNELKTGTSLQSGKYILKKVLGQGGFGITYLAEQVSLGREVAIKEFFMKDGCVRDVATGRVTVPSTGAANKVEQFRKKFFKEARSLASLDHPHIISVIDVFEENGTVYYSMPFMPNGSLKSLVRENGRMPEDEALRYVYQVASALKFMHDRNLCHYDVKPDNILLNNLGEAVLIDFGISKNYDSEGNETSTTPLGISEGYAPIEQYKGISDFSPASDVYALGATLYCMLTGHVPPSALELVQENATLIFDANISERTKTLVSLAMAPATSKRPQSMDCFLQPQSTATSQQTFDETIIVPPKESSPKGENHIVNSRPQHSKSFKRLKIGGYIFLIVAIVAGLSWWAMQNNTIVAKWYHLRAELGNAEAQYNLARCYFHGEGVKKDATEAAKWCRKAAEQGDADAQCNLGLCYDKGTGVEKNNTEAFKWYLKAAEQGNDAAQNNVGLCYENGTGAEKNFVEAVKWYRKAAEQGLDVAQYNMGLCYENGTAVEKDVVEAVKWYQKAASSGNEDAKAALKRLSVSE